MSSLTSEKTGLKRVTAAEKWFKNAIVFDSKKNPDKEISGFKIYFCETSPLELVDLTSFFGTLK